MEMNVDIGGGYRMTLAGAILVYQGGHESFAAWHPAKVAADGRRPGSARALNSTSVSSRVAM